MSSPLVSEQLRVRTESDAGPGEEGQRRARPSGGINSQTFLGLWIHIEHIVFLFQCFSLRKKNVTFVK